MNWSVISREPVSNNRWAQIEVRNHSVYGMTVPQARLVGTPMWYNISTESCGDILQNLEDWEIVHTNITYRVFDSEYVTLRSETGVTVVRISVKGRIAKTTLFGKEVELF
jgi:hypothetical protein